MIIKGIIYITLLCFCVPTFARETTMICESALDDNHLALVEFGFFEPKEVDKDWSTLTTFRANNGYVDVIRTDKALTLDQKILKYEKNLVEYKEDYSGFHMEDGFYRMRAKLTNFDGVSYLDPEFIAKTDSVLYGFKTIYASASELPTSTEINFEFKDTICHCYIFGGGKTRSTGIQYLYQGNQVSCFGYPNQESERMVIK